MDNGRFGQRKDNKEFQKNSDFFRCWSYYLWVNANPGLPLLQSGLADGEAANASRRAAQLQAMTVSTTGAHGRNAMRNHTL